MHTAPASTVTTSSTRSRTSGKVTSPTRPTAAPSTNVSTSGSSTGPPAASAAVMLAAPCGSTPTMRTLRVPLAQPDREAGDQAAAAERARATVCTGSAAWLISSTATVPWPAMVRTSSNGGT